MTDLFAAAAARQAAENKPGLARADHPATSQAAAGAIAPVSGKRRVEVLRMLAAVERATAQFLQTATGLPGDTIRPRLIELCKTGHVEVLDEEGRTFAKNPARRYGITDKGRLALQHHDSNASAMQPKENH